MSEINARTADLIRKRNIRGGRAVQLGYSAGTLFGIAA
jgi:hypothetical protein